jgi:hypothetical protein
MNRAGTIFLLLVGLALGREAWAQDPTPPTLEEALGRYTREGPQATLEGLAALITDFQAKTQAAGSNWPVVPLPLFVPVLQHMEGEASDFQRYFAQKKGFVREAERAATFVADAKQLLRDGAPYVPTLVAAQAFSKLATAHRVALLGGRLIGWNWDEDLAALHDLVFWKPGAGVSEQELEAELKRMLPGDTHMLNVAFSKKGLQVPTFGLPRESETAERGKRFSYSEPWRQPSILEISLARIFRLYVLGLINDRDDGTNHESLDDGHRHPEHFWDHDKTHTFQIAREDKTPLSEFVTREIPEMMPVVSTFFRAVEEEEKTERGITALVAEGLFSVMHEKALPFKALMTLGNSESYEAIGGPYDRRDCLRANAWLNAIRPLAEGDPGPLERLRGGLETWIEARGIVDLVGEP